MSRNRLLAVVFAAAAAFGPMSAQAQNTGGLAVDIENRRGAAAVNGPTVAGNVTIDVETGNIDSLAEDGSISSVRAGAMTDGSVGGNLEIEARTQDMTSEARGDSCSEIVVGVVGTAACRSQ